MITVYTAHVGVAQNSSCSIPRSLEDISQNRMWIKGGINQGSGIMFRGSGG